MAMHTLSFRKSSFFAACLIAACGDSGSTPPADGGANDGTSAEAPVPGADVTVTAFDQTPIYFTGSDNKRNVDATASFPAAGAYEKIILHLSLACPKGGCDPWDRFGSLGIVTQKAADGAGEDTVIEIQRFITPYHVGATWDLDVTELRPILTGDVTLRAFIDTWVGPGSEYGAGWLLSASFEMTGGVPSPLPIAAIPLWAMRKAAYGDPAKPIAQSVPPATLTLPAATSYALRTFVTGHGQGNAGNCAEFCSRKHTITAGTTAHDATIWRSDCETTAAPKQQGTWKYPRAGWCPGADVRPWTVDVTEDVATSPSVTFAYDVESYENTCRPDATSCKGCTLGAACAYDDGNHTEPHYFVSSLLIAYR
jgi:Peptide-N-glycosidase F, C terminal/Peptide-N-glycosidase F, N terminal